MKAENAIPSLAGKTQIPGFDQYFIDEQGGVFRKLYYQSRIIGYKMKEYIDYGSSGSPNKYVKLPAKTKNKASKKRYYIVNLLDLTFPGYFERKKLPVIRYQSESGRKPLKREQVINHLLKFHPTVQIPLTKNVDGVYATSDGMREIGIAICESCGYPQNVEVVVCKECGTWITKPQQPLSQNKRA